MTKIIKSAAVVDDHPQKSSRAAPETPRTVLKGGKPETADSAKPAFPQSPFDQLNRLKIQLEQTREELRTLRERPDSPQPGPSVSDSGDPSEDLTDARRKAAEILADAHSQSLLAGENARNEGFMEGFSQGYEQAREEYIQENAPRAEFLQELIDRLSDYERKQLARLEEQLVELALTVAEKIIGRTLAQNPGAVADMLYQVVDQNKRESYIKITLAKDLAPVEGKAEEEIRRILSEMGANVAFSVEKDAPPGSCVLETPKGLIDLSPGTQLGNIRGILRGDMRD